MRTILIILFFLPLFGSSQKLDTFRVEFEYFKPGVGPVNEFGYKTIHVFGKDSTILHFDRAWRLITQPIMWEHPVKHIWHKGMKL